MSKYTVADMKIESEVVIKQLVTQHNMDILSASNLWFNSRTLKEILKAGLVYASGMRCYWELMLELNHDDRWMTSPFAYDDFNREIPEL